MIEKGYSMQTPYKRALITGASSGIGLSFCHVLAGLSIDLIIVSRNINKLKLLSAELQKKYQVNVTPIAIDLSDSDAPKTLFNIIEEKGLNIDLLINNAGRADSGPFVETPWQEHRDLTTLMLSSLTELCYLFMPKLLSNNTSGIINVSSIAGIIDFSLKGRTHRVLYRPIKSYVIALSAELMKTYKSKGLKVQALCPGLTHSQFHQQSGDTELFKSVPKWMWTTSEFVAKKSVMSLIKSNRLCVIPGFHNRLIIFLSRLNDLFK
jgi:short-subunit dehydrogenase